MNGATFVLLGVTIYIVAWMIYRSSKASELWLETTLHDPDCVYEHNIHLWSCEEELDWRRREEEGWTGQ